MGLALLFLNAISFCVLGAADNSSIFLGVTNISDSGFRPDADGFNFENYGEHPDTTDLTAIEMQRMFGDAVCAGENGSDCILTYPAERWMNQAIDAMKFGHCEGIAVLSNLLYYDQISPDLFNANSTIDLLLQNSRLQREIGYWWTTQVTVPGGSQKVLDSPQAVLDTLSSAFASGKNADEWWVLGIYLPDGSGGHAITPYAVGDSGNGTARIFVYDNNWPKESRFIDVDLTNNSWQYLASSSPDEPGSLYTGNASTKNLEIVSLSSRLGVQQCDFCKDEDASSGSSNASTKNIEVWQSGKASILVTDESGRRVGVLESGQMVNEIPGSLVRNLKFGDGISHAPVILLPISEVNDSTLTVQINSTSNGSGTNSADTALIAPGYALSAKVPDLKAGQSQSMELFSDGQDYNVSLSSSSSISPFLTIETDLLRMTFSGLNLDPTGMINLSTNPLLGTLDMSTIGNGEPGTLQILMTSLDPASATSSTFKSMDLILRTDDSVSMDLTGSTAGTSMPSISIFRKGGSMQKMSMISVSKNVPVSVPDIENLTAGNYTLTNASEYMTTSSSSMSIPSTLGTTSTNGAATGISGTEIPSTSSMQTPTFG